ncbi:MAG: hypothetical protein MZU91_09665 [Desulfosudis oleivorans]|nr:hypothetical protein [Desulfosudis oleivorans]
MLTQKHGDDRGRSFIGAQAMIVAVRGNGRAQNIRMLVNGTDGGNQKNQKLKYCPAALCRD